MTTHDLLWQGRIARYRKQRALLDPLGITVPRGKLIPLRQDRNARIRRLCRTIFAGFVIIGRLVR